MDVRIRCAALAVVVALVLPLAGAAGAEADVEGAPSSDGNLHVGAGSSLSAHRTASVELAERPPWTNTACPEMTDSITRLYTAYFNRQPEQGGFEFWLDAYSQGGWNLDRMSRQFSTSDEFVETYGSLTNAEFVDRIYLNVQGRPADDIGRDFWITELDSGRMTRGRVMIFFSESEEYVDSTQTVPPLAGFLGWYPEGTTWSCGVGAATVQLNPGLSHTDIFFDNPTRLAQNYTIWSYDPNYADPLVETINTLADETYHYYANAQLNTAYGYLEFEMSDDVWWIVVDSPEPMVPARPGWF